MSMEDKEYKISCLLDNNTIYMNNQEYEKALEGINELIKLKPNESGLYFQKGYIYYNLKNYDKAIEYADKSIELGSSFATDYYLKSVIYIEQAKYKEAIDGIKEIIKYVNKNDFHIVTANIFNLVSKMLLKKGTEKYIDDLHKLIEEIIERDKTTLIQDKILYLYKYRKYNERALENIINGTITLSDYNYFNDPADPPIKLKKDLLDKIKDVTGKIKIASLSNNNKNILMWSHYTDSHKGICIKYDMSELDKEKYILKKVECTETLNFYENDPVFVFNFTDKKSNTYFTHFLSLFYTKYQDWEYEKEYRIIYYNNNKENKDKFINIPLKIKAIYLGTEASKEAKNTIAELIKGKDIKLYKMETKEDNLFELEGKEINIVDEV